MMRNLIAPVAAAIVIALALPAKAGDIVDEWASVKAPPPPALNPVTVDPNTTAADVIKDVAPQADDPHVLSGPDKFLHTELEKILKDKGVKTVIAVGTSSNGAVLYTASGAIFRGMKAIVPVDGMSAVDPYADYSAVFTIADAPRLSTEATLTKIDMIKF